MPVDPRRTRPLNPHTYAAGPIVYWMSRDQRVKDNWALLKAVEAAKQHGVPVAVIFNLVPEFLGATQRQYDFMLQGLSEVAAALETKHIPFFVLLGEPEKTIAAFVKAHKVGMLVTDFSPLKKGRQWRESLAKSLSIPMMEVDAHNIVPVWVASPKQEIGARTLRPKVQRLLPEFLTEFPALAHHPLKWPHKVPKHDWSDIERSLKVDTSVAVVSWIKPGEKAAHKALQAFIADRLPHYDADRNDPTKLAQSDLSPYLHFGQLSAQRVALNVERSKTTTKAKDSFLEELIIRRELSDNFCFYQPEYDTPQCFPGWAQKSLHHHLKDKREFLYTLKELETAKTHDPLWNAAQIEMVKRGKMHGYLRMYWAKKILEWTPNPETAMKHAIYLNDKYEIDGRDPNGYTGIAWSIGGIHDRPWFDRPIFGVIRYMSYNGAKSKFDVDAYIEKVAAL